MTIYNPGKYKEIFDSPLGKNIWNYLNSGNGITILNDASENGLPAEDAVNDVLFAKFGDNIVDYEVQGAISHMVQFIMQSQGYALVERNQHPYKSLLFIWSTRYKKTENQRIPMPLPWGRPFLYRNMLKKKDRSGAKFEIYQGDVEFVGITGFAIFEDYDTEDGDPTFEKNIFTPESQYLILSDLTVSEIYLRIKNFYDDVLNSGGGNIVQLPDNPTELQMLDLVEQINTRGFLVFARLEKDKYGVRLEQYANALKKKL